MKIAIIGDIHSNYLVFKKAYDDALSKNVDSFIFLGDYVTDGFDANKVLDIIKNSNGYAINGNREISLIEYDKSKDKRWQDYVQFRCMKYGYECLTQDNLNYIKTLPIYRVLDICNKRICISHSTPYNVREDVHSDSYCVFDKLIGDYNCDINLFGHEHKHYYTEYKNRLFINPGSIGLPADGLPFKYGILTIDEGIKYDEVEISYDYSKLEKYYKESDFYKKCSIWCNLLLLVMNTGDDHLKRFMKYIYIKSKKEDIDIGFAIPDKLFTTAYAEYIKSIKD